jgi:hypothetical protein
MSAPTLHRPPTTPRPAPPTRSRRPRMLLIAAGLVVVAAAAGTSLALTNRSSTGTPAAAPVATDAIASGQPADQLAGQAGDQRGPADQSGQSGGAAKAKDDSSSAKDDSSSRGNGSASADTAKGAAVLADGVHHAHIRKVDVANGRLTVDVVQAFFDGDAVKAAIADGRSHEEAQDLPVWLRNENPRLRTLPVAAGFKAAFLNPCDEPSGRGAALERLAVNAQSGVYFYSLSVRDGAVQSVKERLAVNAC